MQISISNAIGGGGGTQGGGTPTPPPFSNVDSFSFDGVDEYFIGTSTYSELNALQKATWSIWVKPINTGVDIIFHNPRNTTSQNSQFLLWMYDGARIDFSLETTAKYIRGDINAITYGAWNHIMVCVDYTQSLNADKGRIFVNGVDATTSLNLGSNPQIFETATRQLFIGEDANGYQSPYGGNLDEFAIWAGTDQRANVSEIYGGGQAVDLNNLATAPQPTTWFRMGDNATWNGATWTMTDVNGGYINRSIFMVEANRSTDVPTASSFTNTKSILLDGVDDYVDCGTGLGNSQGTITNFSISMWIKPSVTSGNDLFFNIGDFSNSFGEIAFQLLSNNLFIKIDNSAYRVWMPYTNTSAWEHLAFVYDGSNSANTKMYINSILQSPSTGGVYPSSLNLSGLKTIIGAGYSVSYPYSGLQDEVSYFNTTLSQSDITSIYNGGVPNDISSLNPLSWWRCGDGDTSPTLTDNGSGGNNGTMTNFSTFSTDVPSASSFSNTKSILLDGVDDEVSMDFTNTSTTGSISVWIKPTDYTTGAQIVWLYVGSGYRDLIALTQRNDGKLNLSAVDGGSTRWRVETDNVVVSNGAWTHVVFSFDGSNGTIYINGSIVPQTYTITTNKSWWWDDLIPTKQRLGILRVNGYSAQQRYNGNIEEQSVFSSALSSTEVSAIYNNGLPTDLSSESNILAWYRMGDGDTAPTLTDNIGSNNGTMTNFTTFSTDVPT